MMQKEFPPAELQALQAEAKYQLGRARYLGVTWGMLPATDLDRAVSELEDAIGQAPDLIEAYYHLGQAIRAQIERNRLVRAEEVLQHYLDKGAPIGEKQAVQAFLDARAAVKRGDS
jgi:hypothetical protein